jgi:diaminopimelate decarboxylase
MADWETPYIKPHGYQGKLRRNTFRDVVDEIDGIAVEELVHAYGSPVFVVSEKRLRENRRRLHSAFEARYKSVVHGWSYKTNYTSAVCAILHQEGSWAEVVSAFEYEKARSLGVPGNRVIYNGPAKPGQAIERAVAEGARLHIDHLDEIALIEAVASAQTKIVPVTIRLNLNTPYTESWSRFGFNLESGQAAEAAMRILLCPHLTLEGLHCHIGTFILDPRAYAEQVSKMCAFMKTIEATGEARIGSIDIGGGFPSKNALQGIYLPPEQAVPGLEEYVEAVCGALEKGLAGREGPPPLLIYESGRAVVDDAVSLITTVVGVKRLPDGRCAAVLDAGINLMLTSLWYHHPVRLVTPRDGEMAETVLYGPMCMNIDVMRHSVMLPPLAKGDLLVFNPVGAYNNTQWLQFIEYRPAIALVSEKSHMLIRAAETLDDVCRHDRLPSHLVIGEEHIP